MESRIVTLENIGVQQLGNVMGGYFDQYNRLLNLEFVETQTAYLVPEKNRRFLSKVNPSCGQENPTRPNMGQVNVFNNLRLAWRMHN